MHTWSTQKKNLLYLPKAVKYKILPTVTFLCTRVADRSFCFITTITRQAAVTHTQVRNSVNNHTNPDPDLFYNDVYSGECSWFNTCVDHIQLDYNVNNYLHWAAGNLTYKSFSTQIVVQGDVWSIASQWDIQESFVMYWKSILL
jgi:hypothetical protein